MKLRHLWYLLLLPGLSGCETLGFYQQAIWGQWQIMRERVPLDEVLADSATDVGTRDQLQVATDLLDFAEVELRLPVAERYRSFVQLDRDYVVWNVFAAEPFNLDAGYWCYPIVGCAPYRGYFDEVRAQRAAERLERRDMETYLGGVPAYSTLGWFDDPLLSTFVHWPEADLASLLFHELAHGRVWAAHDTAFNESFASFVGEEGARQWFARTDRLDEWLAWRQRQKAWHAFRAFVVQAKSMLEEVYAQPVGDAVMAEMKADAYRSIQACYAANRELLGAGRYDELMAERFNNAFLVSVGTYADWLPAFAVLFREVEGDWGLFYEAVDNLAGRSLEARTVELESLSQQRKSQEADDSAADQIDCKSFASHGLDAEPAR